MIFYDPTYFSSTLYFLSYLGLDITTLRKMLSEGIRLETPAYAPSYMSNHMQQCWNEKPVKRPSYSLFLQTLENQYDLKSSLDSKAVSAHTYVSQVKSKYLKYASLAFHEDSVENRFKKIRNLR